MRKEVFLVGALVDAAQFFRDLRIHGIELALGLDEVLVVGAILGEHVGIGDAQGRLLLTEAAQQFESGARDRSLGSRVAGAGRGGDGSHDFRILRLGKPVDGFLGDAVGLRGDQLLIERVEGIDGRDMGCCPACALTHGAEHHAVEAGLLFESGEIVLRWSGSCAFKSAS